MCQVWGDAGQVQRAVRAQHHQEGKGWLVAGEEYEKPEAKSIAGERGREALRRESLFC